MNELTLPPSPNWYLSNVLACAKDGTIAWGARNAIIIAKPEQDRKILKYSIISNAHLDRVTSLAFSPGFGTPDKNLLVSGGDEHIVRIWNLDTMSAVMAHSYADARQKVICVDWSMADPNLVCCVSSEGFLVSWDVTYNISQQISLGKLTATCLSCCPHNSDLVAIGTKSGLVFIVNMHGDGKVTYKLRGHDAEITSLSWCPIDSNVLSSTDSKDLLLASGGKDRSIFIWRAGGDGRYQTELTLPNSPLDSHQHRSKLGAASGGWSAVCWVEPKLLLATSPWGELISWDLSTISKNKPSCKLVHACHARGLFCIANVQGEFKKGDDNWRSRDMSCTIVWTLAQDRQVVCCKITGAKPELEYNVPTQGGYTYCIAACPLDTSRIAFGVGDAMLRLWNLSEPHENTFDVFMLWQKIKGKVMAVSWHPEKENCLAFGTGEGRVGVFDTNTSKPPVLYRQYHRHAVYSLGWGPDPNGKNYVLYSCGDGELVYHNPDKPNQEPKSVIKKDCTEFAWKPDYSCLAIGFEDGSVSFLNRKLKECGQSIYSQKKAVQCLAWHPESTATDLNLSPLRHQLAVATNAATIMIFDLSDLSSSLKETQNHDSIEAIVPDSTTTESGKVPLHKVVATLNGHSAKIVALAWSPHFSGHLVSASYDNTAQVWKTETQELIGTFTDHCGPVHCCMWSPLDPDLIITGSADFTVRVWRLSKQSVILPLEKIPVKKVRTKKSKQKQAEKLQKDQICDVDKTEKVTADSAHTSTVEFSMTELEVKEAANKEVKKRKLKKCTYFPNMAKTMSEKGALLNAIKHLIKSTDSTSMDQTENLIDGCESTVNEKSLDSEAARPSLFGTKEDIITIINDEKLAHTKAGQYNTVVEMDVWSNNLKQSLQEAAKAKHLNDFLVSLAPSLSVKLWQEMCETYAAQLVFEGNHRKAVSYLLSIHKIHRAIEVFTEAKMYRDAYVLAKCKFDHEDPILRTLLEEWANNATKEGHFEDAVQCYIKLGDCARAAKYLGRRKDLGSLQVAAELALKSGDDEFCATLAQQAVTEALLNSKYEFAQNLVKTFPQVEHCGVQVRVLEEMKKMLQTNNESSKIWDWLEGKNEISLVHSLSNRYSNSDCLYTKLTQNVDATTPETEIMLWINVSHQLAMAVTTNVPDKKLSHIVTALGTISLYETLHPQKAADYSESDKKCPNFLIKLISNLDAKSPIAADSWYANKESTISKSLRAYLCLGLLNWLSEEDTGELEKQGRKKLVRNLIEDLVGDVLDKQTVKHWTMASEVHKLEATLAVAMGKSQKMEEGSGDAGEDVTSELIERLDELRKEKERFKEERVCAPSPILAYSKASELVNRLFNGESRTRLLQIVSDNWTKAIS